MEATLAQLSLFLGGHLENGDPDYRVNGMKGLEEAGEYDIAFLANPRYAGLLAQCRAGVVLVSHEQEVPKALPVIRVANPYLAFAQVLTMATRTPYKALGIMNGAVVEQDALVADDASIYPHAYVGHGVRIGNRVVIYPGVYVGDNTSIDDDTIIYANVSVYYGCRIGKRCIIHSGAVIGADGFGFVPGDSYFKIPQVGIVQIDDDVEIGANSTVDRAATSKTWIQRGVKIDNLVQIGHNCVIGEDSVIVAQVGVGGSSKLGRHVVLAGQSGLAGHLKVGDNTRIGPQSGVMSSVPANSEIMGTLPLPAKLYFKVMALLKRLPELFDRVKKLEKMLDK